MYSRQRSRASLRDTERCARTPNSTFSMTVRHGRIDLVYCWKT